MTLTRRLHAARKAADIPWQQDILRHSFASYHLSMHGDMDATARAMGHTSTATAHAHYLDAVGKAEALRFWSIGLEKQETATAQEKVG